MELNILPVSEVISPQQENRNVTSWIFLLLPLKEPLFFLRHLLNSEIDLNSYYKTTDEKVTIPFIREKKGHYPDLKSCSFDKGFYSPGHREKLERIIEFAILPKKGKLSGKDKERETESPFQQERKKHPGIESAINALENHGLDRCPDHGVEGFDRYISLAVLGRNLQNLGRILQNRENKIRKTS